MRKIKWFSLLVLSFSLILPNTKSYDFSIEGIIIQKDAFISLKLNNLSKDNFMPSPEIREKIFLTVYINNIKRVEYKVKYIKNTFFNARNSILLKTNFRMFKNLNGATIKIHLNPDKIIPETNYSNNILEKKLYLHEKK
jgi:hypothetical protein